MSSALVPSINLLPILSSRALDTFDRCPRRYVWERDWEPRHITTTALLHRACDAALGCAADADPEDVAKAAALALASKLDLVLSGAAASAQPYAIVEHVGWLAGIIAMAVREHLGPLTRPPTVQTDAYEWRSGLWLADDGTHHRVALVSQWDDDRLSAEAHSWATIGELAALDRPLTLHAVVVGPTRAGRRYSPWTRGLLHPQSGQLRFKRRSGRSSNSQVSGKKTAGFVGTWVEVWRESRPELSTAGWLRTMELDGVLRELMISREVRLTPGDPRLAAAHADMAELASRMSYASDREPMRRSSCDETGRGPCPFQACCYAKGEDVRPRDLPKVYRKR